MRERVTILWNANNTFGFDRIDWDRLSRAATITTVSRYMRYRMWNLGVDPLVIPNGLPSDTLRLPERRELTEFHQRVGPRLVLSKVARWDPDKRWLLAIDIVAELKRQGQKPLLIARGGVEPHGGEVVAHAKTAGLTVVRRNGQSSGLAGLLQSLQGSEQTDVIILDQHLAPDARRVLFRGSTAVLANSGHEPFGLVGLEAMAVGGIACLGGTGEDYAIPGWNALVLQTTDPREFIDLFRPIERDSSERQALRRRARWTGKQYTWHEIIQRNLLPRVLFGLKDSDLEFGYGDGEIFDHQANPTRRWGTATRPARASYSSSDRSNGVMTRKHEALLPL